MKVKNSHNNVLLPVWMSHSLTVLSAAPVTRCVVSQRGSRALELFTSVKWDPQSTMVSWWKIPPIPISSSNTKSKVPYQTAPWWPSKVPSLSPLREYLVNESDYNNSPSQWQQGISEDRKTTRSYDSKCGIIDDQNTNQTLGWWSLAEEKSRSPSLKGYHLLRNCWHCALLLWCSSCLGQHGNLKFRANHLLYLICVIERSWPCIIRGLIFTLKW